MYIPNKTISISEHPFRSNNGAGTLVVPKCTMLHRHLRGVLARRNAGTFHDAFFTDLLFDLLRQGFQEENISLNI